MRRLLLGVGGSVSLYKSLELIRRLQEFGWSVTVLPSPASEKFIGRALWEAISQNPVPNSLWNEVHRSAHIELARNNEIFLVAPTTMNQIGKFANGIGDDLISTTFLNFAGRKILVPAAHTQMWENQIVQNNLAKLKSFGIEVVEPEVGALASGDFGAGRYPELEKILNTIYQNQLPPLPLKDKVVLITAGGTREAIDPVRYIGNRSSGKQGFEMARAAAQLGAKVILISTIKPNFEDSRVTFIEVESAMEMLSAVQTHHSNIDISILAAAVADKRPKEFRAEKIKKNALANIELVENPDIAKWIGEHKGQSEKVLLFAAETDDAAEQFAIEKLAAKNGDLIYLNRVDREIFGSEESEGIAIYPDGRKIAIARNSKAQIANQLMQALLQG